MVEQKFDNLRVTQQTYIGTGGDSDAQLHIWRNDNQEAKILLERAGSILLKLAVSSENIATIGTIGNNPLQLQAAGTSGIYLNTNGLVGVGTTTPSFNLDVGGIINATQFNKNGQRWKITNDDIDDNTISGLKIQDNSIPIGKLKDFSASPGSQWVSGSGGIISYSGGNVGIGTSNPQFKLDVGGIINATQFFKNGVPWIISNSEIADNAITATKIQDRSVGTVELANAAVIDTKIADNAVTTAKIADNAVTPEKIPDNSIPQEKLAFQISPPGGSQWQGVDGNPISYTKANVGIGTTTPLAKLQVANGAIMPSAGNSETAGIMFPKNAFGGGGDAAWIRYYARKGEASTLEIGISNDGDDHIALMPSGNVGIGTTNPQDKLDVAGNLRILTNSNPIRFTSAWSTFPDSKPNQAEISNDTGTYKTLMIIGNKSAGGVRRVSIWDYLQVNGGMDITGNVGIGKTNPEALLHLSTPTNIYGGNVKFFPTSGKGLDFSYDGGSDSIFGFTHYGAEDGELRFQWQGENNQFRGLLFITNKGEVRGRLVNTSSRDLKENITDFSTQEAIETLANLNPVKFNYREDKEKEIKIGFIAEDVPELLATHERKGVCAVEIVAVLTQVIKEQQMELSLLRERVTALEAKN